VGKENYYKEETDGTIYASSEKNKEIPYTLTNDELVGGLYAVYVDENGNATRVADSAYDTNSRSLIFTTNHFSVYGVGYTSPAVKFTDISKHWAKDSIDYVVGRGIFSGTTQNTIDPDAAMTRGMMVTALAKLAGADVSTYKTSSFTDVEASSSYQPYIEWAYSNGIIQGTGNNQFGPDQAITREELAAIMVNFAKATGYKLPATRNWVAYADASTIDSVYKTAVATAQQAGIVLGKQNNKFNPKADATRAEVCVMLHRYIKLTIDPATSQGWALNDDGQYLYYQAGKALVGWQNINDKWYYFYPDGTLARSTNVDGYKIDANGVRMAN
jgi:hypothetical protein